MAKDYSLKAEPAEFKVAVQDARLVHTVRVKTLERNWLWLVAYFAITMASIIASYFTSGWWSVGVSLGVAVATFFIGLRMLWEAITITNEVR